MKEHPNIPKMQRAMARLALMERLLPEKVLLPQALYDDLRRHNICITKGGVRIDPSEFYAPIPELAECPS